jgi:hypothetical protein
MMLFRSFQRCGANILLFILTMSSEGKVAKVSAGSSASVILRHKAMLTDQIAAAKEAFGHCKLQPTAEVFVSINAGLDEGIVLPEYHAYIVGAPTTNTNLVTSLVPSRHVVAGGEPIERTVNIIQDAEAMSLLVADGTPCLTFKEVHRNIWDYDKEATKAVVELICTPATMIGHGVEKTNIVNNFKIDNSKSGDKNLLTRPESRGIVGKALTGVLRETCEMVGSTGIGKSWSLLYALQQACLFDGANVCLFVSKSNSAYLFLRRGNKMYSWSRTFEGKAFGPFFHREDVLILYDPPEASDVAGANYAVGLRTLVAALSANEKHFLKSVEKEEESKRRQIGPPTVDQIRVMLPFIGTDDADEAILRIQEVGPLPRYIRTDSAYQKRKRALDALLTKMEQDARLLPDMIQKKGDVSRSADTLPGTVFLVKTKILLGGLPVEEEAYVEADHEGETEEFDYDGRHFWTTERLIFSVSAIVRGKIMQQQRATILSYWGVVDSSEFHAMGSNVEDLFLADLCQENAVTTMKRQRLKKSAADDDIAEDHLVLPASRRCERDVPLKDVNGIFDGQDMVAGMATNTALIDGAGPGKQVEQVTVSDDHSFKQPALISLLKSAGFLQEDNGMLQVIDVGPADKLEFYWVCPPARYAKWKNAKTILVKFNRTEEKLSPAEKLKIKKNKETLKRCLETRVVQYALEMPYASPHSTD